MLSVVRHSGASIRRPERQEVQEMLPGQARLCCTSSVIRLGALGTRYCRNGLVVRSWPIVLVGPWPQMNVTSSPSGSSFALMEPISCS